MFGLWQWLYNPLPEASNSIPLPDVPFWQLSLLQQKLIGCFIKIRVQCVKKAVGLTKGKCALDVGGSSCAFGNAMAKAGFAVTVVEPNSANKIFADVTSGVRFISAAFSEDLITREGLKEGQFDVVTMWHSLEHMANPVMALEIARRLLRQDGCLYVCVPNLDSLQAGFGGNHWAYLDVPRHVTYFTLDGMISLLRQLGYRQVRLHRISLEYEIFGCYQTLLNMISLSYNYFYSRAKKGKTVDKDLRFPFWTKLVNKFWFLLLPMALILSMIAGRLENRHVLKYMASGRTRF